MAKVLLPHLLQPSQILLHFCHFLPVELSGISSFLSQALLAPFGVGSRLYWPFLLCSLALVLIWLALTPRSAELSAQAKRLLQKSYWLNRESAIDAGLALFNSALKLGVLAPLLLSHFAMTIWVINKLQQLFGQGPDWQLSALWITTLFTCVFFIIDDLSRFALHWALHNVPGLWQFHRVHHGATNLTPLTLLRVHPVEMTLYYGRSLLVVGVLVGVFMYLFAGKITAWDVIGINIFAFVFNAVGANLRHTPVAIQFGVFEQWFISPAQHQLHHSSAVMHQNINYGSALAIWDRLVGSWVSGKQAVNLKFGLTATIEDSVVVNTNKVHSL